MYTLYTTGYQGINPEKLKETAKWLKAIVIDIRFSPRASDLRWDGQNLRYVLGNAYRHLPDLGNKNCPGDPLEFVNLERGVATVKKLLGRQNVILLCACWNVGTCHRKPAAEAIARRMGCPVIHLTRSDISPVEQPVKQARLALL